MSAVPNTDQCKAELEAVIASGIFAKAPSLALLLDYVCTKYFEGQANQIKEYNIAVEALGRAPSFEPRQDSIVRVEAFRLRKRLKQYYESEGACRELKIVIPSGQYVPQFVANGKSGSERPSATNGQMVRNGRNGNNGHNGAGPPTEQEGAPIEDLPALGGHTALELTLSQADVIETPAVSTAGRKLPSWVLVAVALGLLAIMGGAGLVWYTRGHGPVNPAASRSTPLAGGESEEIRILCGSPTVRQVDRTGNVWSGDRFYKGGSVVATGNHAIARTPDPELFRYRREGDFSYEIPLKPGVYELHLYFAETLFGDNNMAGGGESSRVFRIAINGKTVVWTFDVLSDAGGSNTADEKVFKDISPAGDGMLHVQFAGISNNVPMLNAIEIIPGLPGKMRPIRIVARGKNYIDQQGQVWGADRYFSHGFSVPRSEQVTNTKDPEMFQSERFGHFSYTIPVADGRYTVSLWFAETWFGAEKPGAGGAGSRVFDVYCNGLALLRNFDVFKAAGGAQRAVEKSFHGVTPNALGKIELSFVPVVNYASINALEVVDESN